MSARHAAVTIVSKNYFALAVTLAQSYKRHHPDNDFIIALVDRADGYLPSTLECGAEVMEIARFAVPDIGRFLYRYTVMELNTAVKPYVMADLFNRRDYETLLYIDPDIWIHKPLGSIYEALSHASIALTPHMRRPFFDDRQPSDLTILRSGTYNLGFLGLRSGPTARRLLEWWCSKLYRDCVVDIPSGLFVDQKWIDLVPGFFPDHRIVHDPTCNVAYWNLHERRVSRTSNGWLVDGAPLTFFHFSGYLPFWPQRLSKHQDRHALARMPALKALTDAYAEALMANGYADSSKWPYAFETLSNGVRLPMSLVRDVMQWTSRHGVKTPDPVSEPDAFCRFLMSRGVLPDNPRAIVLFYFILKARADVAGAFPGAYLDADDPGFRSWLRTSGVNECGIGDLLAFEDSHAITDHVADAFERLRKANRVDVLGKIEDMWRDPAAFEEFAAWFSEKGATEMRFERTHSDRIRKARPGIERILSLYFLRGDLQARYPVLGDRGQVAGLAHWLRENRYALDLSQEEISLFQEFAYASREDLELLRFLYQHRGKPSAVTPGIYTIEARQREIGGLLPNATVAAFLAGTRAIDPLDHFDARFGDEPGVVDDFDRLSVDGLDSRANYEFVKRVQHSIRTRATDERRVNVAGYFDAPTGMGESARSMRETLSWTPGRVRELSLPHAQWSRSGEGFDPLLFGWPQGSPDLSITVANADVADFVEAFLPTSFRARRNVGYWVWETDELPSRFAGAERSFDEIWTPSRHSAEAIARTVSRPVRVLRHTLDFPALEMARADRRRYGLPDRGTIFGFAFDPMSVLERKNVRGLVAAFREAFREDEGCWLALKVNGNGQGNLDYETIRSEADSERILFLEGTLSREDTFGFLKSLDVYVSMHRAEGFGLTCAEAMALSLPVIASGYSGNLEFMDESNSLLVPTQVVETDRAWGPYPAGSRWGDPDTEAAVLMMRSMRDRDARIALGQAAAESVRSRLEPKEVAAAAWTMIEGMFERVTAER